MFFPYTVQSLSAVAVASLLVFYQNVVLLFNFTITFRRFGVFDYKKLHFKNRRVSILLFILVLWFLAEIVE